jgi:hypothetical protein
MIAVDESGGGPETALWWVADGKRPLKQDYLLVAGAKRPLLILAGRGR